MSQQVPTDYIDNLIRNGIERESILAAIFKMELDPEIIEEIDFAEFILEADLDSYLNQSETYSIFYHETNQ